MNRQLRIASLAAAGLGLAATSAVLLAADRDTGTRRVAHRIVPAPMEQRIIGSVQTEPALPAGPKVHLAITDDTAPPNDNKTNDKINETVGGTVHLRLGYNVTSPGYVNPGAPQEIPATGGGATFDTVGGPGGGLEWPVTIPQYSDGPQEYDYTEETLFGYDHYYGYWCEDCGDWIEVHIHIDELHPENNTKHVDFYDGPWEPYDHYTETNYNAADDPHIIRPPESFIPYDQALRVQQPGATANIRIDQYWNNSGIIDRGSLSGQQIPDIVGGLRINQAWGQPQISGDLHLATGPFGQGFGTGTGFLIFPFQVGFFGQDVKTNATGLNLQPWGFAPFGQEIPPPMTLDTDHPASGGSLDWRVKLNYSWQSFGLEYQLNQAYPPPMTLDTDAPQLQDTGPGFQPNSFQFNPGGVQFNIQTFGPGYGLPAFNSPGVFVRPFPPMPGNLPGFGTHDDIGFNESPHQTFINGLNGFGSFQIPASELGAYNFSGKQFSYDLKIPLSNYTSFVWRVADNYPAYDELNSQLQLPPTAHAGYDWGMAGTSRFVRTTVQDSSWNFSSDWKTYIKSSYVTTAIYDTPFVKEPAPNPDSGRTYPAGRELPETAIELATKPRADK